MLVIYKCSKLRRGPTNMALHVATPLLPTGLLLELQACCTPPGWAVQAALRSKPVMSPFRTLHFDRTEARTAVVQQDVLLLLLPEGLHHAPLQEVAIRLGHPPVDLAVQQACKRRRSQELVLVCRGV